MKQLILILTCLLFPLTSIAETSNLAVKEILKSLNQFVTDWNHGDKTSALKTYEFSDNTALISASSVVKGYTDIAAYFENNFPTENDMGKIAFTNIQVSLLNQDFAMATGQWTIQRDLDSGGNLNGIFSLVLENTSVGWKIAMDHTTASKTTIS